MSSESAKAVAAVVLENLRKGKKISIGKIARENGYTANTADNPKNITETKSYQEMVSPVVGKMEKERDRIILALSKKKLSKEKYRDMIDGLDKLTKNIQLLSGKETDIIKGSIIYLPK